MKHRKNNSRLRRSEDSVNQWQSLSGLVAKNTLIYYLQQALMNTLGFRGITIKLHSLVT